ncbi:hypothetical protein ACFQ2M_09050 [Kitasatospora saccharophila]|uniref:hypothetical protein n=1 Tax=Kitasatospora saccharophila TaxID=407973 RepID=UPI003628FA27
MVQADPPVDAEPLRAAQGGAQRPGVGVHADRAQRRVRGQRPHHPGASPQPRSSSRPSERPRSSRSSSSRTDSSDSGAAIGWSRCAIREIS